MDKLERHGKYTYGNRDSQLVLSYHASNEVKDYSFDNIVFGWLKNGHKEVSIGELNKFYLRPDMICMGASAIDARIQMIPFSITPMECFTLEISKDNVFKVLDKINENYAIPSLGLEEQQLIDFELFTGVNKTIISTKLKEIHQLLIGDIRFKDYWIDLKIEELVLCCLQTDFYKMLIHAYQNDNLNDTPLGNAISYMNDHIYSEVNLKKAAEKACMSKATFFRQFKHRLGTTPMHYIHSKRMVRAQKLLLGTKKSIAEISCELGYCNQSYFTKQFKKIVRQNPKKFRIDSTCKH